MNTAKTLPSTIITAVTFSSIQLADGRQLLHDPFGVMVISVWSAVS